MRRLEETRELIGRHERHVSRPTSPDDHGLSIIGCAVTELSKVGPRLGVARLNSHQPGLSLLPIQYTNTVQVWEPKSKCPFSA
jgi:hypothetical protein